MGTIRSSERRGLTPNYPEKVKTQKLITQNHRCYNLKPEDGATVRFKSNQKSIQRYVEEMGQAAAFLTCIREVIGSNLGQDIGYAVSYLSSDPPSKYHDNTRCLKKPLQWYSKYYCVASVRKRFRNICHKVTFGT
jgi:hypothetical protein